MIVIKNFYRIFLRLIILFLFKPKYIFNLIFLIFSKVIPWKPYIIRYKGFVETIRGTNIIN